MSWSHVKSAIESELKGLDKLVYIMIANHVNDDPKHAKCGLAWPSVTTIARETGVTRRSIHRILNRLESDGFLTRENHGTRSTHYRLSETQCPTNARTRKVEPQSETQSPTNAFMGQGDTPSETQCPTASDTESHKPPRETPKEPEEERGPLQGGPLSSLSALGSGQSNPTRASRISALAPGNGGVKSADAKNEEKRWRLYQEHIAELEAAGYQTAGMDPPQAAIAVIDLRIENKKKSQSLRLQNEKNGRRPSDAPTSDTESVAHCQEP